MPAAPAPSASGRAATRGGMRRWLNVLGSAFNGALFGVQALVEILRRGRPDAIHAHDLNVLPAAWLLSRVARAALVYDSHEIHAFSVSIQRRPTLWRRASCAVERFCIRRAAAALTVNPSCAKAIARIDETKMPADHPAEYGLLPRIEMGDAADRFTPDRSPHNEKRPPGQSGGLSSGVFSFVSGDAQFRKRPLWRYRWDLNPLPCVRSSATGA